MAHGTGSTWLDESLRQLTAHIGRAKLKPLAHLTEGQCALGITQESSQLTESGEGEIAREVARRRTFAIISHPDAGKTTLTEKLLLYSGAVELAGAVRTRKNQRHATSDWMAMEQQRGISITTTALQFEYQGCQFNLLDTPGHQDFSEDTYRTLVAVDSAVMVLDSAKGIEPQTKKLFAVCRMRRLPILTFINKMDHPGREPLELLSEIEQVLGIAAAPRNWPIGMGDAFQGVYDLERHAVLRFQRTEHGQRRARLEVSDLHDPALVQALGEEACRQLRDEVELLAVAGVPFDRARYLAGELTPVYFGSALNNFGLEPFLEALVTLAPPPGPRPGNSGPVRPTDPQFSGFVFKIQANMDPQHRDQVAFVRVCSGRLEKDMLVHHSRLGKKVRLSRPHRLFARERETLAEAYAGDVVGLVNPGVYAIGDTLCSTGTLQFEAIPRFEPEHFATLRYRDVSKYKQFYKGLEQLEAEGAIQVLWPQDTVRKEPVLGAVGELQFDVVTARLAAEYGVEAVADRLPFRFARSVVGSPEAVKRATWPSRVMRVTDRGGQLVVLFESDWELQYTERENPNLQFVALS